MYLKELQQLTKLPLSSELAERPIRKKRLHRQFITLGLPSPHKHLNILLDDAIRRRRTRRSLFPAKFDLQTLSDLLYYSAGATSCQLTPTFTYRLAYPSTGNLHTLLLYLYTYNVEGLKEGIYIYRPVNHCLLLKTNKSIRDKLLSSICQSELAARATLILVIVGDYGRLQSIYGPRAYRYINIEAGCMAQNIYLVSESLSLSGVLIGGFYEDKLSALLKLNGYEIPLILFLIGGRHRE